MLLELVLCTLKSHEREIPAVRKLVLQFLGQAIARYSPKYLTWLETTAKVCRSMILAPPSSTEDVWLETSSSRSGRVKYRVMIWPDTVVFVPKTKTTLAPGGAFLVEESAIRLLDEKAATRSIRQRYLLMGKFAGEEWWRDFSPRVVSYGREIPAIEVCAQIGGIDRRRRRIFNGSGNHVIHAVRNLQERSGLRRMGAKYSKDGFVAAREQEKFRDGQRITERAPASLRGKSGSNADGLKLGALVKPYLFHGAGRW